MKIHLHGITYDESDLNVKIVPPSIDHTLRPVISPPTPETIRKYLVDLSRSYEEIICILTSSNLYHGMKNAHDAIASMGEKLRIQLIDSQSISIGLGFLVQSAAEALEAGATSTDVERIICSLIPNIYSVLCIPGLTYLQHNDQLDQAQGIIGEMLDLTPFFSIEEGKLTPLDKMRSLRQTVEFYQEFLSEFELLQHIGLIQSSPPHSQLTRLIRDSIHTSHPNTPFTEHRINAALASMFGPRTMGLIAIESNNGHSV